MLRLKTSFICEKGLQEEMEREGIVKAPLNLS